MERGVLGGEPCLKTVQPALPLPRLLYIPRHTFLQISGVNSRTSARLKLLGHRYSVFKENSVRACIYKLGHGEFNPELYKAHLG